MSAFAKSVALLGILVLAALAAPAKGEQDSHEAELDETIVVDEEPEAFFVTATGSLAQKMRVALNSACSESSQLRPTCAMTSIRFLRAVSVYGRRRQYGFACDNNTLYARNKYFTPADIRSNSSCIYIYCESRDGACDVNMDLASSAASVPNKLPERTREG